MALVVHSLFGLLQFTVCILAVEMHSLYMGFCRSILYMDCCSAQIVYVLLYCTVFNWFLYCIVCIWPVVVHNFYFLYSAMFVYGLL